MTLREAARRSGVAKTPLFEWKEAEIIKCEGHSGAGEPLSITACECRIAGILGGLRPALAFGEMKNAAEYLRSIETGVLFSQSIAILCGEVGEASLMCVADHDVATDIFVNEKGTMLVKLPEPWEGE